MRPVSALVGFVLLFAAGFARAEEGLSADQIAARLVRGSGFTWEGAQTRLRMVLTDAKGSRSERALEVLGRRHEGKLETIVRFLAPGEVAGTAFLMRDKGGGASEQHIYLPGLKRTRRIVGRESEGSFMGSDFTYSDLAPKADKGSKHVRLPDEQIGAEPVYVLESTPDDPARADYAKVQAWIRKKDFVPVRTRFFDRGGKLKKTLYVKRTRDLDGKPVVVEALMKSEGGHATELVVDALDKKTDLPDSAFAPSALER